MSNVRKVKRNLEKNKDFLRQLERERQRELKLTRRRERIERLKYIIVGKPKEYIDFVNETLTEQYIYSKYILPNKLLDMYEDIVVNKWPSLTKIRNRKRGTKQTIDKRAVCTPLCTSINRDEDIVFSPKIVTGGSNNVVKPRVQSNHVVIELNNQGYLLGYIDSGYILGYYDPPKYMLEHYRPEPKQKISRLLYNKKELDARIRKYEIKRTRLVVYDPNRIEQTMKTQQHRVERMKKIRQQEWLKRTGVKHAGKYAYEKMDKPNKTLKTAGKSIGYAAMYSFGLWPMKFFHNTSRTQKIKNLKSDISTINQYIEAVHATRKQFKKKNYKRINQQGKSEILAALQDEQLLESLLKTKLKDADQKVIDTTYQLLRSQRETQQKMPRNEDVYRTITKYYSKAKKQLKNTRQELSIQLEKLVLKDKRVKKGALIGTALAAYQQIGMMVGTAKVLSAGEELDYQQLVSGKVIENMYL